MASADRKVTFSILILIICVLGLFFLYKLRSPQPSPNPVNWRVEKARGPIPSIRSGGEWIPIGTQLVTWGGFLECFDSTNPQCDHVYYNDVYIFDTATNTWQKKNPRSLSGTLPEGRVFFGFAPYPNKKTAIIYGGSRYSINANKLKAYGDTAVLKIFDDMWEYNPATDTFQQITAVNPGPGPRLGPGIVIKGDTLYLFAGFDTKFKIFNDLWTFNLVSHTWRQLKANSDPQSPPPRYIFKMELDDSGDNIYFFGGNNRIYTKGPDGKVTGWKYEQRKDLWKYNIPTNTFTAVIPADKSNIGGRTHGAAAIYRDQFVIALGDAPGVLCKVTKVKETHNPSDQVWVTDISNQASSPQWEQVPIMQGPPPLKRVYYAKVNNRLYVGFGFNYICKPTGAVPDYNSVVYSLPLNDIHYK